MSNIEPAVLERLWRDALEEPSNHGAKRDLQLLIRRSPTGQQPEDVMTDVITSRYEGSWLSAAQIDDLVRRSAKVIHERGFDEGLWQLISAAENLNAGMATLQIVPLLLERASRIQRLDPLSSEVNDLVLAHTNLQLIPDSPPKAAALSAIQNFPGEIGDEVRWRLGVP